LAFENCDPGARESRKRRNQLPSFCFQKNKKDEKTLLSITRDSGRTRARKKKTEGRIASISVRTRIVVEEQKGEKTRFVRVFLETRKRGIGGRGPPLRNPISRTQKGKLGIRADLKSSAIFFT